MYFDLPPPFDIFLYISYNHERGVLRRFTTFLKFFFYFSTFSVPLSNNKIYRSFDLGKAFDTRRMNRNRNTLQIIQYIQIINHIYEDFNIYCKIVIYAPCNIHSHKRYKTSKSNLTLTVMGRGGGKISQTAKNFVKRGPCLHNNNTALINKYPCLILFKVSIKKKTLTNKEVKTET